MSDEPKATLDAIAAEVRRLMGRGWHIGAEPWQDAVVLLHEITHEMWYLFTRCEVIDNVHKTPILERRLKEIAERRPWRPDEGVSDTWRRF